MENDFSPAQTTTSEPLANSSFHALSYCEQYKKAFKSLHERERQLLADGDNTPHKEQSIQTISKQKLRSEAGHWAYLPEDKLMALSQFQTETKNLVYENMRKLKDKLTVLNWSDDDVDAVNQLLELIHIQLISDYMRTQPYTYDPKRFDLSNCYLSRFPEKVFDNTSFWQKVGSIYLNDNALTQLSIADSVNNLFEIQVMNNALTFVKFPTDFKHQGTQWCTLFFTNNLLTSFPAISSQGNTIIALSDNQLTDYTVPQNSSNVVSLNLKNNCLTTFTHPSSDTLYNLEGNLLCENTLILGEDTPQMEAWKKEQLSNQKDMKRFLYERNVFKSFPGWLFSKLGPKNTAQFVGILNQLDTIDFSVAPDAHTRDKINELFDTANNFLANCLKDIESNTYKLCDAYLTRLTPAILEDIEQSGATDIDLSGNFFGNLTLGQAFITCETLDLSQNPYISQLNLSIDCICLKRLKASHCSQLSALTVEGYPVNLETIDLSDCSKLTSWCAPSFMTNLRQLNLSNSALSHLEIPNTLINLKPSGLQVQGCYLQATGNQSNGRLIVPPWFTQNDVDNILYAQFSHREYVRQLSYIQSHKQDYINLVKGKVADDLFKYFMTILDILTNNSRFNDKTLVISDFQLNLEQLQSIILIPQKLSTEGVLDLSQCHLFGLPTGYGLLEATKVIIDGNPIGELEVSDLKAFPNLKALSANGMPNLQRFTTSNLIMLEELSLTGSLVSNLDMYDDNLSKLRSLNLEDNQLTAIYIGVNQAQLSQSNVKLDKNKLNSIQEIKINSVHFSDEWVQEVIQHQNKAHVLSETQSYYNLILSFLPQFSLTSRHSSLPAPLESKEAKESMDTGPLEQESKKKEKKSSLQNQ